METLFQFLTDNLCVLFFLNGLAFFALGLAVALGTRRASKLPMSQSLWLLSVYGFVASLGSWLQMFLVTQHRGSILTSHPYGHDFLKLLLFVAGSLILLQFSVRILGARDRRLCRLSVGFWLLAALYTAVFIVLLVRGRGPADGWIASAEIWARYLLYFPALALASLGFLLQRGDWSRLGLEPIARDSVGAGASFAIKAVVSGLAAVPVLGLAQPAMSTWGLLLQLARAATTLAIAYSVVRLLRAYEIRRRQKVDQAIAERLEAQEQALQVQQQACSDIRQWSTSMAHTLHSICSAISQPTPFDQTVQVVLRDTLRLAGLESGAVFLVDEDEPVLHLAAHQGLPGWLTRELEDVAVGQGLAGWVAAHGELLIVDDLATDTRTLAAESETPTAFFVGIPLEAGGKRVGVMSLSSTVRHELTQEQVALLDAAGHQLGAAIESARLHCRLHSVAVLEERLRLSRELHDSVVQVLAYLHLKSRVAQTKLASQHVDQVRSELEEIEQVTARAYDEVRDSILGLRVTLTSKQDVISVVEAYSDEFSERHEIEVTLDQGEWEPSVLTPEAGVQVLRIVQEALTNSWKHGRPNRVWITFRRSGDWAQIQIRDDGLGFDPARVGDDGRRGFGLQTMKERAHSVGGRLEVRSEPGQGTEVEIEIPVR